MHNVIDIETSDKRTPETNRFYNDTKFGVGIVDQMSRKYSAKSKSVVLPDIFQHFGPNWNKCLDFV